MKKKIIILLSSLFLIALLILGVWFFYPTDITPQFQKLISEAQDISVKYWRTSEEYNTPVSRPLLESEVEMLCTLKFKKMPAYQVGYCDCKWNPIFTITNRDGTKHVFGVGCSLTIEGKEDLPPGDHPLTEESTRVLKKWLKEIGIGK